MTRKKQASDRPQPDPLLAHYERLVSRGEIKDDRAQRHILRELEELCERLRPGGGLLKNFFKKSAGDESARGIYIWGGVGRGKSMLMDLFFARAPVESKRRVHFHAFMQEVHARIHELRKEGGDAVATLAKQLAGETSLLCFDELQATDVADATLLYRLFHGLFEGDVTIVSTSNHPPASLYTGGVQRERFAKFITLIEENMRIASLSTPLDYRHLQMKAMQRMYMYPLGAAADEFIADTLERLCVDSRPRQEKLPLKGRTLALTLYDEAIGRFTFRELCESALGAADYLALGKRLDTLILTGIPRLPPEKRNEARRFVTLIDALYEHKVKLVCTAAVPPQEIYNEGDGAFEFQRTVSRLAEMQSAQWMEE